MFTWGFATSRVSPNFSDSERFPTEHEHHRHFEGSRRDNGDQGDRPIKRSVRRTSPETLMPRSSRRFWLNPSIDLKVVLLSWVTGSIWTIDCRQFLQEINCVVFVLITVIWYVQVDWYFFSGFKQIRKHCFQVHKSSRCCWN